MICHDHIAIATDGSGNSVMSPKWQCYPANGTTIDQCLHEKVRQGPL